MLIKSLEEFKDSVYFLSTEARWVKKRLPLRVVTGVEYQNLVNSGMILFLNGKVYVQSFSGRVNVYDKETQYVICDENALNTQNRYFIMGKDEYEDMQNHPDTLLYYYYGKEGFTICDLYKRVESIMTGDYLNVGPGGGLIKVYNFEKFYCCD